jgi:hypothetical protein
MLFWNTINFAGLAVTFTGSLLLALFSSCFELRGQRVFIRTWHGWLAVIWFSIGFILILIWGIHLLQTGG